MPVDAVFLVNGNSRSGAEQATLAKVALESNGFNVTQFVVTTSQAQFTTQLDKWVKESCPLIAVGGGDGTQRSAAERIAGTDSAIAVVPLGTGNAWATDLGLPTELNELAKALSTASVESINLGIANDRGFVNVATIGLTSLIAKNLPSKLKGRFGKLVYLPAVIKSLTELRPFLLKVTTEGDQYEGMALQFVAAAGRTHAGPFRVTRHASNNDGLLSLYALDDTDKRGLAKFGLGLLTGMHTLLGEVWSCEAQTATVTTGSAKRVIVDGERSGSPPLVLSIRPRVLKVLVPKVEEPKTGK